MITCQNNIFKIDTLNTTYLIRINSHKHVISEYYGSKIDSQDNYAFSEETIKYPAGSSIAYDESDSQYSLDMQCLEISSIGKGDYKEPSIVIKCDEGYVLDLCYQNYKIQKYVPDKSLPYLRKADLDELIIETMDSTNGVLVELHYVCDVDDDVIIRNIIVKPTKKKIHLLKASSMQLEMPNQDFTLVSTYGTWGSENNIDEMPLKHGIFKIDSKTGASSNRHNPFFMLKEGGSTGVFGNVYAFNLMYSGNHEEIIELSTFDKVRIQNGINSFCFDFELKKGDKFVTPLSVMTFSSKGSNGASINMHHFVENFVIKDKVKVAPIVINNWEATFFDFNATKLRSIIRNASKQGMEMFVLDDGWFSTRNNDHSGLGDYDVNTKKIPGGLNRIANYAKKHKMKFGLWFEPEMVNEDSRLFRLHSDWIIKCKDRTPSKGRNQYVLNLSRKDVQDYIIENVSKVLHSSDISYIKWDMNRHMSDVGTLNYDSGEMFHRYMLGLYRVFDEITSEFPNIYYEGCSSGGNRFDLGILNYFDQIWTSDDTDAYERIKIQSGTSLGYPLRCISNHVSTSPSNSVLRNTPLDTRINVALFGSYGFELDLTKNYPIEDKNIAESIKFYKKYRLLIRDGDFYQLKNINKDGYALWLVVNKEKSEALLGYFQGLNKMNRGTETINLIGLDPNSDYQFTTRKQILNYQTFGSLVHQAIKIKFNERGPLFTALTKRIGMDGEKENYIIGGKALMSGALKLDNKWIGTGVGSDTRTMPDFASRVYVIKKVKI